MFAKIASGFFILVFSTAVLSKIVYKSVTVEGRGATFDTALVNAFENAIGQINGLQIATSSSMQIRETIQNENVDYQEGFSQDIEKATKGVVKSYKILAKGSVNAGDRKFVKIEAVIPVFKKSAQTKRRKLAVLPYAYNADLSVNTEALKFSSNLSRDLESYLVQTRKFAMIDRRLEKFTDAELNRVSGEGTPIEEKVKYGNRLGADYLVVGVLRKFEIEKKAKKKLSGDIKESVIPNIVVDYRIVDVATGQIKYAKTHKKRQRLASSQSLADFSKKVAGVIGEDTIFAIYPMKIISKNADIVTLNQGNETVKVGRVFNVMKQGKALIDPYTKEKIGREEILIGQVKVENVTAKFSTGKLIGDLNKLKGVKAANLVVRPVDKKSSESFDKLFDSDEFNF
jgi:curli biogenesis system outer membrane secretion channel CsgG